MSHELKPVCLADMSWPDIKDLCNQQKLVNVTSGDHKGGVATLLEEHRVFDTVVVKLPDRAPEHISRIHLSTYPSSRR
ncbi:hypothetical protein KBC40_03650 [Patescibacteria group bacterium]|jgi:hypothetical protein|nr:hypothetical protein [Patescibacteria group bacterium]